MRTTCLKLYPSTFKLFFSIIFVSLSFPGCKPPPKDVLIIDPEREILKKIQNTYRAKELQITELEEFDRYIKNSIHVNFIGGAYDLADSTTHEQASATLDSILHVLNDEFKYNLTYTPVAVSFSQERGNLWRGTSNKITRYQKVEFGKVDMNLYHNKMVVFSQQIERLNKQGKNDSIKMICKKIPSNDSLYLSALSVLGQLAGRELDTNSFIYYFSKMREIQKDNEQITLTLAKVYGEKMQYDIAKKYIDTTLAINSRNAFGYYYKGLFEFYTGNNKRKVLNNMQIAADMGLEDAKLFLENKGKYYPEK